ncbi:metallophosphoesterase [Methanoregula sp.]|uniref:metallophosphoesterase family protein n=1 Tax=Methanoregula sp. TaxID=2052170 RepID=UPI002B70CE31|nr:metallophosphoesterase [Methanoregula sp.]HVP97418.1 metallophosphoesterase [Methanoregula sp.]
MGTVVFSDVHADADALGLVAAFIQDPSFQERFGPVDTIINLGDLLHRGNCPEPTLSLMSDLSGKFRLISVIGNHDHAYLNGVPVSGSDEISTFRHEQLRGSPLLGIFTDMPMEWVDQGVLFVHGGPLDLGTQTLRLKCWQRLSHTAGDSFTGYHYTASMAFEALERRGLSFMVCGHQHTRVCCRKTPEGINDHLIRYIPEKDPAGSSSRIDVARVPMDMPTLFRIGGCHGDRPEFAFLDGTAFTFIRLARPSRCGAPFA